MKRLKYQDIVKIVSEFLDEPDTIFERREGSILLGKRHIKKFLGKTVDPVIHVHIMDTGDFTKKNEEFKEKFKKFISKKENVYFIDFVGFMKKINENENMYYVKELGKCFLHSANPILRSPASSIIEAGNLWGKKCSFCVYMAYGLKGVWELSDLEAMIEAL